MMEISKYYGVKKFNKRKLYVLKLIYKVRKNVECNFELKYRVLK